MTSANIGVVKSSRWIVWGAALLVPACGAPAPEGTESGRGGSGVETYEVASDLPSCTNARRHQVYYVSSEDQFYVCEGGVNQPLELPGASSGASLILVEDEPPGGNCIAGGHVVHVGLDQDDDGILDPEEITASDYVCNPGTTLAGDLHVDEQGEVDALAGVTWIIGNLSVSGDLDLSPLRGISRISGGLRIGSNPSLVDLGVLENLIDLEGTLIVEFNDALDNIDALASIVELRGNILIADNAALTNVDGLSGITTITSGSLELTRNPSLANIDGLAGLTSVDGAALRINDNDALTNIDGLAGLTNLYLLALGDNDALLNVDGLAGLTSIGNLSIVNNDALTNLAGLAGVTSISALTLEGNASLTDFAGLAALTSTDQFFIVQTAVSDLDDLGNLASVTGTFFIVGNPNLTTVQGLTSLEQVGFLIVQNHPNLPQCDVDALAAGIDMLGGSSFFDNTGSGTCMP